MVAESSLCPTCGVDFRSRLRLMTHLERGALGCVLRFRLGALPEISEERAEQLRQADAAEFRAARRLGKHWSKADLPAFSAHQASA